MQIHHMVKGMAWLEMAEVLEVHTLKYIYPIMMTLISMPQDFLPNPRKIAWFRLLLRCQAMLPLGSNVKVLVVSQKKSQRESADKLRTHTCETWGHATREERRPDL